MVFRLRYHLSTLLACVLAAGCCLLLSFRPRYGVEKDTILTDNGPIRWHTDLTTTEYGWPMTCLVGPPPKRTSVPKDIPDGLSICLNSPPTTEGEPSKLPIIPWRKTWEWRFSPTLVNVTSLALVTILVGFVAEKVHRCNGQVRQ